MRSFHKMFWGLMILLYTSCAEQGAETVIDTTAADSTAIRPEKDSIPATALTTSTSTQRDYPELLLNWEKELQSRGVKFNLDNFYASSQHEMNMDNWNPLNDDFPSQRSYSPDSTRSTYTVPGWIGGEPDTYLFMVDEKTKRVYTLEVWGTCSSFEDSGWKNDSVLVTYGYEDCSTEMKYPDKDLYAGFYAYYNFNTQIATYYSSKNFFRIPGFRH